MEFLVQANMASRLMVLNCVDMTGKCEPFLNYQWSFGTETQPWMNCKSLLYDIPVEKNLLSIMLMVISQLQNFMKIFVVCFLFSFVLRCVATDIPSDLLIQVGDVNFHLHKVDNYSAQMFKLSHNNLRKFITN